MERVKGIDVSKWQGLINWQMVANDGIHYVFIRVGNRGLSKGTISKDAYFDRNIQGALAVGLKVGVYFFSSSVNEKEAIEEANFVIENIKGYDITMPVVFDFEGFSNKENRNYGMTKEQITNNCIAFQNVIKSHGYTCLLYGSQAYISKKFDLEKLTEPLWVARYASSTKPLSDEKYFPKVSGYGDRIAIWQYASCGTVSGINAKCDMNYMYIDVSTDGKEEETMKTYKKGQAVQLSKNFKSTEFDCNGKGCCSGTPIATELVKVLQNVRDHFGVSVDLNCGYRCPVHNAKTKGASKTSQHMNGNAADIVVKGVHPVRVARYLETIGFAGRIGCYTWDDKGSGFVHVDVRGTNSRGIYTENNTNYDSVSTFTTGIKRGSKGRLVKVMQRKLRSAKLYYGLIDGKCGSGTEKAIIKWNAKYGRKNDASWGPKCWNEAFPL